MDAIRTALNTIFNRIPTEILNLAFIKPILGLDFIKTTLEDQITKIVIKGIVLERCNLVGGRTLTIDVTQCNTWSISYNPTMNMLVIEVPYVLTDNKDILSPLSLTYYPLYTTGYSYDTNRSELLDLGMRMMDRYSNRVGGIETTNLELIGPNTVMVHENILTAIGGWLRVNVEHDDNLRDIKPRAQLVFSELCLYATQGYIHNKLIIELDKGYIFAGHELNKVQEIIDSYSDAWEKFDELLREKWAKISFINDDVAHSRFLKSMINPVL